MTTGATIVFLIGGMSSRSFGPEPIYETGPVHKGHTNRPVLGFSIGIVPQPLQIRKLTPSDLNI